MKASRINIQFKSLWTFQFGFKTNTKHLIHIQQLTLKSCFILYVYLGRSYMYIKRQLAHSCDQKFKIFSFIFNGSNLTRHAYLCIYFWSKSTGQTSFEKQTYYNTISSKVRTELLRTCRCAMAQMVTKRQFTRALVHTSTNDYETVHDRKILVVNRVRSPSSYRYA